MFSLLSYIFFTDSSLMTEILVIVAIVAAIGAVGFTILHFSMRDDRWDRIIGDNQTPWSELGVQNADTKPEPKITGNPKGLIIRLILMIVGAAIALIIISALWF